jgi:hypothetical protein
MLYNNSMIREYKVGDKVKIKSLSWYRKNANKGGDIVKGVSFVDGMQNFCGKIMTIEDIETPNEPYKPYGLVYYLSDGCNYCWQAFMFEEKDQLEFDFGQR